MTNAPPLRPAQIHTSPPPTSTRRRHLAANDAFERVPQRVLPSISVPIDLRNAASFVYDLELSIREVAQRCGVSLAQVRRALKEQEAQQRVADQRSERRSIAAQMKERTRGELHDLAALLGRVERTYFPGELRGVRITWGRKVPRGASTTLGSYTPDQKRIIVHPVFERAPRYVVECVIHHEALHHIMGPRHSPPFKQRLQQFRGQDRALRWISSHC